MSEARILTIGEQTAQIAAELVNLRPQRQCGYCGLWSDADKCPQCGYDLTGFSPDGRTVFPSDFPPAA